MTGTHTKTHPTEVELAGFLSRSLSAQDRNRIEEHMAFCGECLKSVVSAYESVKLFGKKHTLKKGRVNIMKKINLYLILAIIAFVLSFAAPRYFLQLLLATLLLGIKWVADSKSAKMLIMIYEAWKRGGEKEASRIIENLEIRKRI